MGVGLRGWVVVCAEEEEKALEMEEVTDEATAEAVEGVEGEEVGARDGRVALVGGASKSSYIGFLD